MKYARTLRILGIAIILSLLMAAIPAMPALAYGDIELDPEEGAIGDEIEIKGEGFSYSIDTNERLAQIIFALDEASLGEFLDTHVETYEKVASKQTGFEYDSDKGEFETSFEVPDILNDGDKDEDVTSGTYYIYITYLTETGGDLKQIVGIAEFTVIGGAIEIDPEEGPVYTPLEITGEDFPAKDNIDIEYDGDEVDIEDGDDETDSNGDFESIILIPESSAGDHTITVIVGGSEAEAEFTVEPDILANPQSGEAGTEVIVSGTGFARRPKEVTIYFNNAEVAIDTPDTKGSFETEFFIPDGLEAGSYTIEAEDEDDNLASASFNLIVPPPPEPIPEPTPEPTPEPAPEPTPSTPSPTSLTISHESGKIGTQVMMGGAGFEPNGTITVKYDAKVVTTVTADDSGIFVATFPIPASKYGTHTITASDGTSTEELTFTVESVPPAIPSPLLPEMGVKVKSPISFDWEDVTAENPPVTYALQIATDEDFTADSIILEKTQLTRSEYALTEEEELKLAGQETPYYWRIRAIDAALTEGEWTGTSKFYVTSPFALPSWALYTLLGIGAVLIFGIGYWLGRRTAFYY